MRLRYMEWAGHFLGFVLVLFGIWYLSGHLSAMPDYKLIVSLVAMTGLILNHFRWRNLTKKIKDAETFDRINLLVVSNYLLWLLAFVLVDFYR